MSHTASILLYISITLSSTLFAFKSQSEQLQNDIDVRRFHFHKISFLISFLIPWFFLIFTNLGPDYARYSYWAQTISPSTILTYNSEIGFSALLYVIKLIVGTKPDLILAIVKTITIIIFYISIYLYREKIRVGYSVLFYLLFIYFRSYNLLRIALATAVVSYAFGYYSRKHKSIFPLILVALSSFVHSSAVIILLIFIFTIIFKPDREYSVIKKIIIYLSFFALLVCWSYLYNNLILRISDLRFNEYYSIEKTSSFGMGLLLYCLPPLAFLYIIKKLNVDPASKNIHFILILSSCLFRVLAYSLGTLDRVQMFFYSIYLFYYPQFFTEGKLFTAYIRRGKIMNINLYGLIMLIYIVLIGVMDVIARIGTAQSYASLYGYVFHSPF